MAFDIQSRVVIVRRIWGHAWVRLALWVWAAIATYDTALSQIIPTSWGQHAPKIREFIAVTSGWLPFWGWLLILAAIVVTASLEYAFRMASDARSPVDKSSHAMATSPQALEEAPAPIASKEHRAAPMVVHKVNCGEAALNLEILYKIIVTGTGRRVSLKYSSDSKTRMKDNLLLILYGYKQLINMDEVPYKSANESLAASAYDRASSATWTSAITMMNILNPPDAAALANDSLQGYVERVKLSEGGMLRLTDAGCRFAYRIACDLITRA